MRVPKIYRFIIHHDWYTRTEDGFYIPTEKAPQQAISDMEIINEHRRERLDWLRKNPAVDDIRKRHGLPSLLD